MAKQPSNEALYRSLLTEIKQQVRSVQVKAALAVNTSLIRLYWNLSKMTAANQVLFKGRNNYVEQLVKDLRTESSDMSEFSRTTLLYVRKFYRHYSAENSVQQLVGLNDKSSNSSVQQLVAPIDFNANQL